MASELTVICWRDIPLQLLAKGSGEPARALLSERFQEAVDASAMVAGLIDSDDYTGQMRMERHPCGDDLEAEVEAERSKLESEWTEEILKTTIRAGGFRVSV